MTPQLLFAAADQAGGAAFRSKAVVVQEKDIDSLHLTVVKGGAFGVGKWAEENGFVLSPDAPAVLDFYAKRSPYFMAVQFDANKAKARGERLGDAIPIHLVMKTDQPWVPLRILGLGAPPNAPITADVFLLTDQAPNMLPVPDRAEGVGPGGAGPARGAQPRGVEVPAERPGERPGHEVGARLRHVAHVPQARRQGG